MKTGTVNRLHKVADILENFKFPAMSSAVREGANALSECKAGRDTQARSYAALSHDHMELKVKHSRAVIKYVELASAVRESFQADDRVAVLVDE